MAKKYIVNLKDIAEATGVSVSTVSRVIKKKGEIAPDTRNRVLSAAKKLGYQSNLLIEGMRKGKTRTIGVCANITDPYLNKIICGIHDALEKHDYAMMLSSPIPKPSNELSCIHRLMQHRVEGIIVRPCHDNAGDEYFREVIESGVPLITIDRELPNANIDHVGSDDLAGGITATEYLISLGHKNIAHIPGPQYTSTGRLRKEGFLTALALHPEVKGIIAEHETFDDSDHDKTEEFFRQHSEVTAVFAPNDNVAISIYKVMHKLNRKVPEDMSVIAFSDVYSKTMIPELTAIEQRPEQIGIKAVEQIFSIINNDNHETDRIKFPPQLVERNSVVKIN